MTDPGWPRLRYSAQESVELLARLLSDRSVDERRLVAGYLDAKRQLAQAFEAMARERYPSDEVMQRIRGTIERKMWALYPDLPRPYLRVKGFARVHERILEYLAVRVGEDVAADELRILSGDAVHTERRARELRDLGLELVTREVDGLAYYRLVSLDPDAGSAAANLMTKNIRGDSKLSGDEKEALIARLLRRPAVG